MIRRIEPSLLKISPTIPTAPSTEGGSRFIVAVDVTNEGNDHGQLTPMHQGVRDRYGITPKNYLVDCGFNMKEDITTVEQLGTQVYAPIHGAATMPAD